MPYSRPTLTALKSQALSDITGAGLPGSTGGLLQKSILRILALVQAGMAYLHYQYLDWISLQSVPFTATDEFLEGWAALKGIYREDASAASGPVQFTGTGGAVVPTGTLIADANSDTYVTQATYTIGTTSTVQATASTAGSQGNQDGGNTFTLVNPIAGVTSTATSTAAFTGGADQETDDALRTRMLYAYAHPPQGGSASDFVVWATQVPGVTRAWVNAQGLGPGTVVVYVMCDVTEAAYNGFPQGNSGGATAETRIAAATGDQLIVANHIYPLRPVTSLVAVYAPVAEPINITITGLVYLGNLTTIKAGIAAAISDLFVRVGTPLGMTVYPSDINAAISSVPGVTDFTLTVPSTTTTITTGYLPTLGLVTYS